jgi:hypothetical protein
MSMSVVRALSLLLMAAVGVSSLAGCSGEVSFTTAKLSEATMCLGTDAETKPVNPTDEFGVTTTEIFCSVRLSNAPDDTEVLSEWVYLKGELEGVTNYVIDSFAITTEGTRYLEFSMTSPDDGWPKGEYKVVLYIDGKEEVAVPFMVTDVAVPPSQATFPPATVEKATLTQATLALDVDAERKPINATTQFAPDTAEIHCSVLLSNATAGTEVLSEWYYVSGELQGVSNVLIDSVPITVAAGTQYLSFSLSIPDTGWPVGEYELLLYLDDTNVISLPFSVVSTAVAVTEATMTREVDAQNRPTDPATTFTPTTPRIYCSVFLQNVPEGSVMRFEWYYLRGSGLPYVDHLYAWNEEAWAGGSNYAWFSLDQPESGFYPVGDFMFVLYLDGVEHVRLPFSVS